MQYEAVIGLEIHAQLLTKSKIFCGCSTTFGAEPNTQVCPVCIGMPGVLPVLNRQAVGYAIKMAIATNCKIDKLNRFARKNYFYPDLPKGYQISQFERPLAVNGYQDIDVQGKIKRIGITRIHMEEDAGKLLHQGTIDTTKHSYVDLNRTGVPLIEIVSEPDMRTSEEAVIYLRNLRKILLYLEICDGNMEEGSFRCDANVSIRKKGEKALGTKAEVKNMNSFRFIQKALDYEIERQIETLEDGGKIIQETRLWDAAKEITLSMRGKEAAHDYRYFPEPDLLPMDIDQNWIEEMRAKIPELPQVKEERFIRDYKIPQYDAEILTSSKALADFYEECVKEYTDAKVVSNWIMGELLKELKKDNRDISDCLISAKSLADMLKMVKKGTISGKIAKTVFEEMYKSGKSPEEIVKEKGLVQISDEGSINKIVLEVIEASPSEVERIKQGDNKLIGFFVGQVMKKTAGKA
ncbi:MAG: Asp-tRNA(Asn)/Glu-tRNA(Gln) amidotransferase subunit GatB, partial [Thermodesulfobacteriota bacterium]